MQESNDVTRLTDKELIDLLKLLMPENTNVVSCLIEEIEFRLSQLQLVEKKPKLINYDFSD